jgi:hypothetical protein
MRIFFRNRVAFFLCLLVLVPLSAFEQSGAKGGEPPLNSSNTVPMKATSTVHDCVTVEAVLLAHKPASKLFGGFVADHYAVVKTTISNHCSDQQFILHDIYFDYSNWSLSGVFPCQAQAATGTGQQNQAPAQSNPAATTNGQPTPPAGATTQPSSAPGTSGQASPTANSGCTPSCCGTPTCCQDDFTAGTRPGRVATVGALDVQLQLQEDSVFSPRNMWVGGLTLVGQVAQGYAFIWSDGAAQGIGAYNSAFVENLKKFWPDRRIDQQKFLLALGYRTDQSTAIAKDDHGSYYAFFPLETFLTPELKHIFLENPAVFLNPAEALFDLREPTLGRSKMHWTKKGEEQDVQSLRKLLLTLGWAASNPEKDLSAAPALDNADKVRAASAQMLRDLSSPCTDTNPCGETDAQLRAIKAEKYMIQHASLNSVQIVARGVMTVEVDSIPPTIDTVTLDNEKEVATWTVAAKTQAPAGGTSAAASTPAAGATSGAGTAAGAHAATTAAAGTGTDSAAGNDLTGTITGKFLKNGKPTITSITVPNVSKPSLDSYVAKDSLQAVTDKASDNSLPFKLKLIKTLPTGSKLTFQVTRQTTASDQGQQTKTLTSNNFDYTVDYEGDPNPSAVHFENEDKPDTWSKAHDVTGTVQGKDLDNVSVIKVSAMKDADGKDLTVSDYIGAITPVTDESTSTTLTFKMTLAKAVPAGSKMTFTFTRKVGDVDQTSAGQAYTVPKAAAAAAPAPAKTAKPKAKTAPKPAAPATPKPTGGKG